MSYHRVLPKPRALSGQDQSESRTSGPNALLHHKIMTDGEPTEVPEKSKSSRSSSVNTPSKLAVSQRSASLESLQDYEDSPTVEALPIGSDQKRTSSPITTRDRRYRDLPSLSTASPSLRSADSASQVCLCQPDPKVPRPRNAFILYRQHYQSAVASQHPGLANPEISKIIGEQWRQQPAEVKNEWKILAEEEKIRHQQQYPDYRYQPRRSGRNNSTASSLPSATTPSTASATPKCLKCGGRSMTTPNLPTPLTPITPLTSGLPPPTPSSSSSAGRFLQLMGTPKIGASAPGPGPTTRQRSAASTLAFNSQAGGMAGVLQLSSLRDHHHDEDEAASATARLSPDPKRRRFNSNGGYVPVRQGSMSIGNGQRTPFPFPQYHQHQQQQQQQQRRRESIPQRLGSISAPSGPMHGHGHGPGHFPMGPPPRPSISNGPSQRHNDPSLTLPPLQTTSNSHHSTSSLATPVSASASTSRSQTQSVEAMVMTIPYINKIKVLAKISPPLPHGHGHGHAGPSTSLSSQAVRGAVIAVDGQDRESVQAMVKWLEEFLGREGEYMVRIFGEGDESGATADGTDDEGGEIRCGSAGNPFVGYLEAITAWHRRSEEIVRFVTGVPGVAPRHLSGRTATTTTTTMTLRPWADGQRQGQGQVRPSSPAMSPKSMPADAATTPPPPSSSPSLSTSSTSPSLPEKSSSSSPPVPIALIPRYQLSLSDSFASSIPINDAYAPVDHWQWMATLWRGVVGPDVTVYIKDKNGDVDGHEDGGRLGGGTGVEVRLGDARAIVVRKNAANGNAKGAGLGEGALRRVGFEVGEWVRGMGSREDGERGYLGA